MKQLLLIAFAILVMSTGSSPAQAARRDRGVYSQSGQGGVFSRMMELERRKNARLREIFLRR